MGTTALCELLHSFIAFVAGIGRCKKLDIDDAYIIRNNRESYSHNDRVRYACRDDSERRFTVTCNQGVWTGIESCTGKNIQLKQIQFKGKLVSLIVCFKAIESVSILKKTIYNDVKF